MELKDAITALSALAQEHRLAIFRLLVAHGPDGLSAGAIAQRVGVPASTLSHHLAHLERAGLLCARRCGRHIFYSVEAAGLRRLIAFLTEDCCGGRPEICGYASTGGTGGEHHDLPQPTVRNLAECPGDDPQLGRGAAHRRVPEDAADSG